MTFTFKLSKRLAQAYAGIAALSILSACSDDLITDLVSEISGFPAQSIAVAPATVTLGEGETAQLGVTLTDSTGQSTQRPIVWTSDEPLVAAVSSKGEVRGLVSGTATITAEADGHQATSTVTVMAGAAMVRAGHYASPEGSSSAQGTKGDPWDLATALAGGGGRVRPGDTIWLRGGTYRAPFRASVSGAPGAPVVVRQYPGERAIIDAAGTLNTAFHVGGDYTVYWGFEITNSNRTRTSRRGNVIANYASHTKYINLIVHDGGVGFYTEPEYVDVEVAGCIFYNGGWQGSDRGHGHAIYLKSRNGPVVVRDNVMFNHYGYGLHIYSNAGSGQMNNIRAEANVSFNNGTLSSKTASSNILLGGDDYATGDALLGNVAYYSRGILATNVQVGYGTRENGSVQVRDNYVAGGSPVLDVGYWKSASVSGNSFVGTDTMVAVRDGTLSGHAWSNNLHQRDPASRAWTRMASMYTFSGWRTATGLNGSDLARAGLPTTTSVIVRVNPYEAGRGTVVVLNWGRQGSAVVSLEGVLRPGDRYEVRNVQRLFGAPVASGTYSGGAITLSMSGVTPPVPIGLSSSRAPKTGPEFDVFLVTKVDS